MDGVGLMLIGLNANHRVISAKYGRCMVSIVQPWRAGPMHHPSTALAPYRDSK
jgi:hypothetical protein